MDGINHESVVKLAAAGAWGRHTNNISRDLKAMVTKEGKGTFALPKTVTIPCWNPRKSCNEDAGFSFFDPVTVIQSFFGNQELFEDMFKPSLVKSFWQGIRDDDPRLEILFKESCLKQNDLEFTIPLWLHGDGVEFVDGRSLMSLSFGSILNAGPSLDSSLLLFAFPKDCTIAATTWEHVWAHIATFLGATPDRPLRARHTCSWQIQIYNLAHHGRPWMVCQLPAAPTLGNCS